MLIDLFFSGGVILKQGKTNKGTAGFTAAATDVIITCYGVRQPFHNDDFISNPVQNENKNGEKQNEVVDIIWLTEKTILVNNSIFGYSV